MSRKIVCIYSYFLFLRQPTDRISSGKSLEKTWNRFLCSHHQNFRHRKKEHFFFRIQKWNAKGKRVQAFFFFTLFRLCFVGKYWINTWIKFFEDCKKNKVTTSFVKINAFLISEKYLQTNFVMRILRAEISFGNLHIRRQCVRVWVLFRKLR